MHGLANLAMLLRTYGRTEYSTVCSSDPALPLERVRWSGHLPCDTVTSYVVQYGYVEIMCGSEAFTEPLPPRGPFFCRVPAGMSPEGHVIKGPSRTAIGGLQNAPTWSSDAVETGRPTHRRIPRRSCQKSASFRKTSHLPILPRRPDPPPGCVPTCRSRQALRPGRTTDQLSSPPGRALTRGDGRCFRLPTEGARPHLEKACPVLDDDPYSPSPQDSLDLEERRVALSMEPIGKGFEPSTRRTGGRVQDRISEAEGRTELTRTPTWVFAGSRVEGCYSSRGTVSCPSLKAPSAVIIIPPDLPA